MPHLPGFPGWRGGLGRRPAGGRIEVLAAPSLLALINHFKGAQVLSPPTPAMAEEAGAGPDLRDIKGQVAAKRALELAAAGSHNLAMIGPNPHLMPAR